MSGSTEPAISALFGVDFYGTDTSTSPAPVPAQPATEDGQPEQDDEAYVAAIIAENAADPVTNDPAPVTNDPAPVTNAPVTTDPAPVPVTTDPAPAATPATTVPVRTEAAIPALPTSSEVRGMVVANAKALFAGLLLWLALATGHLASRVRARIDARRSTPPQVQRAAEAPGKSKAATSTTNPAASRPKRSPLARALRTLGRLTWTGLVSLLVIGPHLAAVVVGLRPLNTRHVRRAGLSVAAAVTLLLLGNAVLAPIVHASDEGPGDVSATMVKGGTKASPAKGGPHAAAADLPRLADNSGPATTVLLSVARKAKQYGLDHGSFDGYRSGAPTGVAVAKNAEQLVASATDSSVCYVVLVTVTGQVALRPSTLSPGACSDPVAAYAHLN